MTSASASTACAATSQSPHRGSPATSWVELILRVGRENGYWPEDREIVTTPARLRPGVTDVMALRVGYEKLHGETGWEPVVSWEEGVLRTIEWYAANHERWIGRVDWRATVTAAKT